MHGTDSRGRDFIGRSLCLKTPGEATMSALHLDARTAAKPETRKTGWLAALEKELKRRVGWTDAAISPFGRKRRRRDGARVPRAA
jgi:hypothetical protein